MIPCKVRRKWVKEKSNFKRRIYLIVLIVFWFPFALIAGLAMDGLFCVIEKKFGIPDMVEIWKKPL